MVSGLHDRGVWVVCGCACFLSSARQDRPRLVIEAKRIEKVSIPEPTGGVTSTASTSASTTIHMTSMTSLGRVFDIAYLHVCNRGSRAAEAVHLRLRYLRDDECLFEFPARWSDTPQDVGYESTQTPHQRDLAANEMRHKFDVAAKFPHANQCYAINDESRFIGGCPVRC